MKRADTRKNSSQGFLMYSVEQYIKVSAFHRLKD